MVTSLFDQEDGEFLVLVNKQNQYSLWPKWKEIPGGWKSTGVEGNKKHCCDYIESEWKDMRPTALRQWIDDQQQAI